jgi:hypothetical protein
MSFRFCTLFFRFGVVNRGFYVIISSKHPRGFVLPAKQEIHKVKVRWEHLPSMRAPSGRGGEFKTVEDCKGHGSRFSGPFAAVQRFKLLRQFKPFPLPLWRTDGRVIFLRAAGSLSFPTRSTTLTAMTSGWESWKVREV